MKNIFLNRDMLDYVYDYLTWISSIFTTSK